MILLLFALLSFKDIHRSNQSCVIVAANDTHICGAKKRPDTAKHARLSCITGVV
jgi:hypothetical protein